MPNRRQALTRPEEPQPRYGYGLMAPITTFEPQPPGSGLAGFGDLVPIAKDYAGRVVRGEVAQEGLEHYGNLLRRVEQRDPQALNELVGELGFGGIMAGPMAKTANKAKLAQAEALEQAGDTAEDIYRQTGWFKGTDGKWRWEIDDSQLRVSLNENLTPEQRMQMLTSPGTTLPTGSIVEHDELFAAYPGLRNIPVELQGGRSGGSYDMEKIRAGWGFGDEGQITLNDPDRSILLHELQHAIQQREGFAGGGNPQAMANEYKNAQERFSIVRQKPEYSHGLQQINALRNTKGAMTDAELAARETDIIQRHPAMLEARQLLDLMREIRGEPNDVYRRLAGETEARTVQARRGLNLEQRQERPPWLDYDVPPEQQIVRYGGGEARAGAPVSSPTQTPEFQNWFGGSKVVDESGQPLRVYHGTNADFDSFRSGPTWFTPAQESGFVRSSDTVMPVYLRLKNPLVTDNSGLVENLDDQWIRSLSNKGYDGVVFADPANFSMPHPTAHFQGKRLPSGDRRALPQIVAFDPTQIKSAVGNRGTFDPNDPNIMMSLPEPPPTSGLQIPGRNR